MGSSVDNDGRLQLLVLDHFFIVHPGLADDGEMGENGLGNLLKRINHLFAVDNII